MTEEKKSKNEELGLPRNPLGMKTTVIAFDCDGTLVTTDSSQSQKIVANERVRTLLVALAHMKNVKIIVWSGAGEMWARQVVRELGLSKYVNMVCAKEFYREIPQVDIAIDDIQDTALGKINLIVREK